MVEGKPKPIYYQVFALIVFGAFILMVSAVQINVITSNIQVLQSCTHYDENSYVIYKPIYSNDSCIDLDLEIMDDNTHHYSGIESLNPEKAWLVTQEISYLNGPADIKVYVDIYIQYSDDKIVNHIVQTTQIVEFTKDDIDYTSLASAYYEIDYEYTENGMTSIRKSAHIRAELVDSITDTDLIHPEFDSDDISIYIFEAKRVEDSNKYELYSTSTTRQGVEETRNMGVIEFYTRPNSEGVNKQVFYTSNPELYNRAFQYNLYEKTREVDYAQSIFSYIDYENSLGKSITTYEEVGDLMIQNSTKFESILDMSELNYESYSPIYSEDIYIEDNNSGIVNLIIVRKTEYGYVILNHRPKMVMGGEDVSIDVFIDHKYLQQERIFNYGVSYNYIEEYNIYLNLQ